MYDVFVVNEHNNPGLFEQFPHAQQLEPADPLALARQAAQQSVTELFWIVGDSVCSDLSFEPEWHQQDQIHYWASDLFLVPRSAFLAQHTELDQIQNFKHVRWHTDPVKRVEHDDIVIWDFGNPETADLRARYPDAAVLRYIGTHLDMVRRSLRRVSTPGFWILSSCCDYRNFDPLWKPDWEHINSIHCWASGNQQFGDTFYIPAQAFAEHSDQLEKLEYYPRIQWHTAGYKRHPWPVNTLTSEDIFSAVTQHRFTAMYEYFVAPGSTLGSTVDPPLWGKRPLIAYNRNGHVSLCPRDCISEIRTSLRDYPYIQYHSCEKSTQMPQDIVFISYDEKDADLNYDLLKNRFPHARRIHGVDGMINALKIAATQSTTPWFFAVFAKTVVAENFDFTFGPDYLEVPGNYIFQSYNRNTHNKYGHGAVLLYHSRIVRDSVKWGYDFTTSFPYTSIPMLSCYLEAKSPWEAWRTSFREVLKLKAMDTIESRYRLNKWCTVGNGEFGEWSIKGAADAMNYCGPLENANDWNWLKDQFEDNCLPDQSQ